MRSMLHKMTRAPILLAVVLTFFMAGNATALIDGIISNSLDLTARVDYISGPDGGSMLMWGYADGAERAQYPGPTLIVNQGQTVTITLKNELTVAGGGIVPNVSIVFPGISNVTASGGTAGLLTNEAAPGGVDMVTYSFDADKPGTYLYHSGTRQELQTEMGLFGVIIIRPTIGAGYAYSHPDTGFDREYLFLLSEMDPNYHQMVEFFGPDSPIVTNGDYLTDYFPAYWFINGRNAPDTLSESYVSWLPTQPYNSFPRMHPGEKILMRVVNAGRDLHPFHHHGNHARVVARDANLLESAPGLGPDLSHEVFTVRSIPGKTVDAIFEWTGKDLGWDVYGATDHTCNPGPDMHDPVSKEYCPDHGKPIPVALPEKQELAFGGFYGGSPYLGTMGSLPPGEGGLNPNAGFVYMWHSHTEKEIVNWDLFPGGMMTMLIVEPPGVPIP